MGQSTHIAGAVQLRSQTQSCGTGCNALLRQIVLQAGLSQQKQDCGAPGQCRSRTFQILQGIGPRVPVFRTRLQGRQSYEDSFQLFGKAVFYLQIGVRLGRRGRVGGGRRRRPIPSPAPGGRIRCTHGGEQIRTVPEQALAEIQKLRTTQHCGNTCIFIRTGGKSHFHPSRSGRTQHWRIQPYGQGGPFVCRRQAQGNVAPLPQPNRGAVQSLQIGRNFRASPVQAGVSAGVKTGTGRAGRRCCHRLRRNRVRRSCNVRHGAQQQAAGHKDRRHCGQPSRKRGEQAKNTVRGSQRIIFWSQWSALFFGP